MKDRTPTGKARPLNNRHSARAHAFVLFCLGLTHDMIAGSVGVAEATLTKWKNEDDWVKWREMVNTQPAPVPPWGVRVLELLTAQQKTLARLEAHCNPTTPDPTAPDAPV